MGTTQRLWRWRSNPLRRQEDVVEAWVVLIVWALALVGGVLAALVPAVAAEDQYAEQRAHRHAVGVVLLADAPHGVTADWSTDTRVQGSVRLGPRRLCVSQPDSGTTATGQAA
ncbi:hypothetical protein [Streptomyces sp. NPDC006739]|uniref:hypothetical protein n=1 Tax=Streptomyces sp. NPDC006739 TaxID=3364763 RepID=UPI0036AD2383